jgi:hypothetical protein
MAGKKKIPERRSGLRPSEKDSGTAFRHKNTPANKQAKVMAS